MKLYHMLFVFPFIQNQIFGRVITSNLETNQDVDVYSIQEDTASHTITMINPKSAKPTLREIIYYHVIEKPYDNNENVITTTESPVTTEAPIMTDATTNLIDDPTTLLDNTDLITNDNAVEPVTTKSLEEIFNFGDVSTDNSNVDNEYGAVNTDTPIESNTDGVTSLNEAVDTDLVISTDAPIVLSTSNEPLDSDDNNNGFNEVNFGSLGDDSVSENDSLDGTTVTQYNPEAINMDSLSRSRRDLADTPNTYGMDLSGDQGTVWNDVSAKGVKFDVGDPNFENIDDDVQITDDFINTAIQDPQIKEDIDNTQTEIMDDNEDNIEIINNDHIETSTINPFLKSLPEEESETLVDQSDFDTTMDEEKSVTSDSETIVNQSNSVTSKMDTKIDESKSVNSDWEANVDQSDTVNTDLKSIVDESETVHSDLETTVDQSETINSDMKAVEKQDTKLWGMNLNQNSGTVWNDFAGSNVEYGVGNNGNIVPDLNTLSAVNVENSETVTSSTDNPINPDIAEPMPIVLSVPDENIETNETEDSDDFFVTPSTKDLIHESTDLPTEDTSIIQEQDIEEETMANEEVASDVTENSEIMNIPEGPTLPPLDLDNLPGFMDTAESSGDIDANSETTEDSMGFRNLPIDDNESLIDDITDKYDNEMSTVAIDSNVEDSLSTTEINLDAYVTEGSLDSTTEIPLDSTTDFVMAIDENDDKITDDLTDLLKNRKFFNWIQTWAAAYSEMFQVKVAELVKEEVTKQIGELDLNCCQKNINGNTDSIDIDDKQEKVRIDSNTIYGNAVGNENVTNMFLFFDKNNDKILEILKPLIDKSSDESNLVHYISPNLETSTDNNESTKLIDDEADILDSTIDNLESTTEELPLKNYKIKTRLNKYLSPEWVN